MSVRKRVRLWNVHHRGRSSEAVLCISSVRCARRPSQLLHGLHALNLSSFVSACSRCNHS